MTKISGSSAEESDKHQNVWNENGPCVQKKLNLAKPLVACYKIQNYSFSRLRLKFGTNEITPVQNFWPLDYFSFRK